MIRIFRIAGTVETLIACAPDATHAAAMLPAHKMGHAAEVVRQLTGSDVERVTIPTNPTTALAFERVGQDEAIEHIAKLAAQIEHLTRSATAAPRLDQRLALRQARGDAEAELDMMLGATS